MTNHKLNPDSDPSLGYYPLPGWEWQKPEPKTYLRENEHAKEKKLADTAKVWILNLVEFVHWILLIPSFILSYLIFQHTEVLTNQLGTGLQVYLLSVTPVIQAFAGLVAVVMHEYEGWQVVYFQNPLDSDFDIRDCNNEWLREIAYKMLFMLQVVGLLAFSIGVFGVSGLTLGLAVISLIIVFLFPQNPKATFRVFDQPVFPISVYLVVAFVINAIINFISYFFLFGSALSAAHLPSILSGLAPVLFMLGGLIEGIFAESTFNQWIHFWAVIFLNVALLVQIYCFSLLW